MEKKPENRKQETKRIWKGRVMRSKVWVYTTYILRCTYMANYNENTI
jgi:hypothetical protein